jgi:hypothetical protein
MIDRDAFDVRTVAAGRRWLCGFALAAIAGAILAPCAALAGTPTRADAVITALALEQGRHCVVTRGQAPGEAAHVTVRGEACDGRRFIRAILALLTLTDPNAAPLELDLDIDVKALDGFHDESLHDVTLRLSVRRGVVAAFALAAKLGKSDVSGRLSAPADHGPTIAFEAGDAGAFLRWSGFDRQVRGGALTVAMDVPTVDGVVDDGVASLRNVTIADDPALRPLARSLDPRHAAHLQLVFARLRVHFKSQSGRVTFSEGLITGDPVVGTLAGDLDLMQRRLDLHGVVVPTIQFSQIAPISFLFRDTGVIGWDYAISGSPSAPRLGLGSIRAVAPGFLRKVFEFGPREQSPKP